MYVFWGGFLKYIRRILIIISLVGLLLGIAGTGDTILLLSGKKISFTDEISDFSEKALIDGEIDFAYGPFAVLEETQKRYGATISRNETEFYIVSNIESGKAFVVLSTSDDNMKEQLFNASEKWVEWLSTDDDVAPPEVSIKFTGKLANHPSDKDYDTYYNQAVDDLSYTGVEKYEYASMRIIEGDVPKSIIFLCFGGYAVAIIGAVIFIMAFISARRNRND